MCEAHPHIIPSSRLRRTLARRTSGATTKPASRCGCHSPRTASCKSGRKAASHRLGSFSGRSAPKDSAASDSAVTAPRRCTPWACVPRSATGDKKAYGPAPRERFPASLPLEACDGAVAPQCSSWQEHFARTLRVAADLSF